MGDPRQNARPGDPLRIAAEQINYLNSLMRASGGFTGQGLQGWQAGTNLVMVKNTTGADVPRWGVLAVTGVEIDPSAGESQATAFQEMACVRGAVPAADTAGRFVVALEPIPVDGIGRAVASGVVAVKLDVANASDKFAGPKASTVAEMKSGSGPAEILWKQTGTGTGKWALVRIGGRQPPRLGKTTASWLKNTTATIDLYEEGTPPTEAKNTSNPTLAGVMNKFADIGSGKWVMVSLASNGYWYVISAEC